MKHAVSDKNKKEFSKYLSYILRHKPEDVGLSLLKGGYVKTDDLISAINSNDKNPYIVTLADLKHIVETDNKKRYSFKSEDDNEFMFIRANQGHSIKNLMMDYDKVDNPPEYLYHGTSEKAANEIIKSGALKPMSRQMVHLSKDIETAKMVGKRHEKVNSTPTIFRIDIKKAIASGKEFYISENGVYLVDQLEVEFLEKI